MFIMSKSYLRRSIDTYDEKQFIKDFEEIMKRRGYSGPKIIFDDKNDILFEYFKWLSEELLPYVSKIGEIDLHELKEHFRTIRLEQNTSVNCFFKPINDKNDFEIIVNSAFAVYCHKMVKLFVANFGIGGESDTDKELPILSFDETVEIANRLINGFLEQKINFTESIWLADLKPDQQDFVNTLLMNMERFAIAHEFGHALIRLTNGKSKGVSVLTFAAKDFAEKIITAGIDRDEIKEQDRDEYVNNWSEEFAADLIGRILVSDLNESVVFKTNVLWAVELFFICGEMIEYYMKKSHKKDRILSKSHPNSKWRLIAINEVIEFPIPPDTYPFGPACESLAKSIVDNIVT